MEEQEILTIDTSFRFSQNEAEFKDLSEWWKAFKSRELDNLVHKALTRNFEIQESLAVVEQQKAVLKITEVSALPTISAELEGGRSYSSSANNDTVTTQEESDSYKLGLSASYTVDLYGEAGYNLTAKEMTLLKTIEDHKTLVSQTVQNLTETWLTIQELEARISLQKRRIQNSEENVRFVIQRHVLGLSTLKEVLQAKQGLIGSKSNLPELRKELIANKHASKVLIGEYPRLGNTGASIDFGQQLPKINPGLPSELIKRRSDVRSALLSVKIADNQVGAAIAATFPQISLTASTGTSSSELKNLIDPDYAFWNLIGNITLPILDASGRKFEVEKQKAALKESLYNYKYTVFKAFKEVADNLSKIEEESERIELLNQQVLISRQTFDQTLISYREGLADWSEVLDSQSDYYDAEDSLILAEKQLISLKISLIVSLGESWMS